ncbi:MAG: sigma 54-interacting transcriptional regulator [Leptospiraceae bacterium]|nr:sigma 54-interacting transcriptional regulator [Leptospiraceae bacterium]
MQMTIQSVLRILLEKAYISRRQYRVLQSEHFKNIDALKELLLGEKVLDPPDWREIEPLLQSGRDDHDSPVPGTEESDPPESRNPRMHEIQQTAMRVASSDTTVLLLGESGVGKSRLARLMHLASHRRSGPLITVACGSIPETLLESELFGVEKGAYTGASSSRPGRFQRAHGGTIFLDEIGELGPPLQVKLLRVLQERKVEPLGSSEEVEVDIRLIAATNRNLEADVRAGRFREDLYYRLNVVPLTLPPLRERPEDILPLVDFFLEQFSRKNGQRYRLEYENPQNPIAEILSAYTWPGNIRELENCLERLTVLSPDGSIQSAHLPPRIRGQVQRTPVPIRENPAVRDQPIVNDEESRDSAEFPTMREMERRHILEALHNSRGNVRQAARLLDIHRNTLTRKLDDFDIDAGQFKRRRENSRA